MSKRARICLAIVALAFAVNLVVGYRVYSAEAQAANEEEAFEKISVMMRVIQLIRKDYVDADKVDYESLVYNALHGMVNSLDPFSDFMPPEQLKEMMEETEGEFGGLGVIVTMRDDWLTVVSPMEGTPGFRAGLQPGDRIVKIGGMPTDGLKVNEAVSMLKGKAGTSVGITVYRPREDKSWDVTIVREMIPVISVKDDHLIEGTKFGYVQLLQFNDPTAQELETKLKGLIEQGAEGLVLDLRNNPGGLLTSAADVCSLFLKPGMLVVSTEGRRPSQKQELRVSARGWRIPDKMPVVILVNGGSASAAEIVSGCLSDHGRAILVGERTFGKGSVQNVIDLPDGSALRLTTAMYYTPNRRVIHHNGIMPDLEVVLSDDEYRQFARAAAVIEGVDASVAPRDRQLERAVEALRSGEADPGKLPVQTARRPDEEP
jgi:carboxyl-terminal processing protease